MVTFGLSAVLALLVAVLGLYSLMAHMVAWRTREIGIRLALGANDPQITRLVAGNGVALAGAGVLVGLLFTLAGGRWLQPHLFRTSPFDPLVLTVVAVTLLAVALLAGWIPARRAVRISPTEALRAE
jgi:ABC-type antimicrobial peptide transport system permease subunit